MSITKHITFKIAIDDALNLEEAGLEKVNQFLLEANVVYVNHSIVVLSVPIKHTNNFKTVNKTLVVSLVYKDLSETSLDLQKVSKKMTVSVKKTIEEGEKISMPNYQTKFEKSNKKKPTASNSSETSPETP